MSDRPVGNEEPEPLRPTSYLDSLARSAAIVSRVNTPAIAGQRVENCECGSITFRVIYDPKAQGRSIECNDCGRAFFL